MIMFLLPCFLPSTILLLPGSVLLPNESSKGTILIVTQKSFRFLMAFRMQWKPPYLGIQSLPWSGPWLLLLVVSTTPLLLNPGYRQDGLPTFSYKICFDLLLSFCNKWSLCFLCIRQYAEIFKCHLIYPYKTLWGGYCAILSLWGMRKLSWKYTVRKKWTQDLNSSWFQIPWS